MSKSDPILPVGQDMKRLVLLILLLLFYCAPQLLILAFAIYSIGHGPSGKIDTDSWLFPVVSELGKHSGIYTNTIHQMILPVAAAITAARPETANPTGNGIWVFILPLVTIFACIANALLLILCRR